MGSKPKLTDLLLCPQCGHSLSESMRASLETAIRKEFEDERSQWLASHQAKLEKKAKEAAATQLEELKDVIAEKEKTNEKLRKEQLALRKKERELEEAQAELKLEIERRLEKEKKKVLEQAVESANAQNRLKLAEKDKMLSDMQKQIEELKKKSDVTSQKLQGDVQEADVYDRLTSAFPDEEVSRIKSGKTGADVLMVVRNSRAQACGKILFESKRTKSFQPDWTGKLRSDMRAENADVGVIVSETLPRDVTHAAFVDGVWVVSLPVVAAFTAVLRNQLIEIRNVEAKLETTDSARDQIFQFVSGPVFRQRLAAILEGFIGMQQQLESEQRAMQTQWAKRSQTIQSVIQNTSMLYGELSGIAALPEIPTLALEA